MDNSLRSLLRELEIFGAENDARETERPRRMLNITPETGEFLAVLVQAMKARRVLEIGTSNGYSTIWLANAVRGNAGTVTTVDINPAKVELARKNFERAGLGQWIEQHTMNAGDLLRQQPAHSFDFVFLDSARWDYTTWWESLQKVIAPAGLLVVDNATSHPDEMQPFIDQVLATPGWHGVVVPIGKGEFMATCCG